ncbi:MAG: class I SAM-dependent methyltransferase [Alphaproteobacteria bacterium]|nr:class I SAM-dependent methyltransferase [Alphaproteobacteria bacterium]
MPPQKRNKAVESLVARIAATGPVSVADFMDAACSHYYAQGTAFGTQGDFTTAPEISQMFGEMIAACLADAWMQAGKPEKVQLIELGPGRGTLAADVMRTFAVWPDLAKAASLHLVETSPALRDQQAKTLEKYPDVHWHERLEDVPEGFTLLMANEFFDALPIRQFEKLADGWAEKAVGFDAEKDAFFFTTLPLEDIAAIPPDFQDSAPGSVFETGPASLAVMETLAARIEEQDGLALVFDYGHAGPALGDTLQSLRRHEYTKVLENVGEQDVTAHVDFSALGAAAGNALVHGPVTQHDFLGALGIAQRAQALAAKASPKQRMDIERALYRLTAPSEMGHLFKVLGLTRGQGRIRPAGFDATTDGSAR